jgi:hypothetical protein
VNSCTFGPGIPDTCATGPSWWTLPHCLGLAAAAAVILAAAIAFWPALLAWLRPRRRAVTLAGLAIDLLAFLALTGGVLAGAIPAGRMTAPAITLAAGISTGTAYLYFTRPRSKP